MASIGRARLAAVGLAAVVATVLGGCSGSGGSSSSPTVSSSGSVSVPADALITQGHLTFCSDLTTPPLEYLDAAQQPTGVEVDLGNALAQQMGLTAVWANTSFNGIIPALQAKRCDAILSQLFIKPAREKVVDFVPYMYSSSTVLVTASQASSIKSVDDLCGKKAAAETGTTIVDYLQTASSACTSGGKQAIDVRLFTEDSAALQQLKIGLVDAYGTTLESAAYVIKQQPGVFATAGEPFGQIKCGIATRKGETALHGAIAGALAALHSDGTYAAILTKWGLSGDALPAS